jgi:hypothetical protein
MPGQKPEFRFITKTDDGKWKEIGAAWKRASGSFGVTLSTPEGAMNCLMVPNVPKSKTKVAEIDKPAV